MTGPGPAAGALTACDLGTVPYRDGLALQEAVVSARAAGRLGDWLLFLEHPPVLTVGRGAGPGGLRVPAETLGPRGIELFEVARGGDITWHGPGQLVGYPVFDLAARGRDLHRFLRGLEASLVNALARLGIEARPRPGRTGVWVGEEKIASIGIAVRRWVSYHGFALNVAPDLGCFDLIHPCGLRGVRMTSLAALLGAGAPRMDEVREVVAREIATGFGHGPPRWASRDELWRLARGGRATPGREPARAGPGGHRAVAPRAGRNRC